MVEVVVFGQDHEVVAFDPAEGVEDKRRLRVGPRPYFSVGVFSAQSKTTTSGFFSLATSASSSRLSPLAVMKTFAGSFAESE